jgi:hypothetical protein
MDLLKYSFINSINNMLGWWHSKSCVAMVLNYITWHHILEENYLINAVSTKNPVLSSTLVTISLQCKIWGSHCSQHCCYLRGCDTAPPGRNILQFQKNPLSPSTGQICLKISMLLQNYTTSHLGRQKSLISFQFLLIITIYRQCFTGCTCL